MLKEYWKRYGQKYWQKTVGVVLVILGIVAFLTPLTPGSVILVFLGLELLGFKFLFIEKAKERFKNRNKKSTDDNGAR